MKTALIWVIVIVAIMSGSILIWVLMPEHQKTFWKTFIKQIPNLPGRMLA